MSTTLRTRLVRALPLLAAGAALLPASGAAQDRSSFDWNEALAQGTELRVFTLAGEINVTAASGREARVRGEARGGDREGIRFEARREGNVMVVCAYHEEYSTCDANGVQSQGRGRNNRREARADLTVEVPAGVNLHVGSGNGEVRVAGATGDVRASSGNGVVRVGAGARGVRASSGNGDVTVEGAGAAVRASSGNGRILVNTANGPVHASTGNGDIEVTMAALGGEEDLEFSSGNGDIVLSLPADFAARVSAVTGHGRLSSDFAVTLDGQVSERRMRGTIGRGSRSLQISTGNGDIELRRR